MNRSDMRTAELENWRSRTSEPKPSITGTAAPASGTRGRERPFALQAAFADINIHKSWSVYY
jgi:hypothetical protein